MVSLEETAAQTPQVRPCAVMKDNIDKIIKDDVEEEIREFKDDIPDYNTWDWKNQDDDKCVIASMLDDNRVSNGFEVQLRRWILLHRKCRPSRKTEWQWSVL